MNNNNDIIFNDKIYLDHSSVRVYSIQVYKLRRIERKWKMRKQIQFIRVIEPFQEHHIKTQKIDCPKVNQTKGVCSW